MTDVDGNGRHVIDWYAPGAVGDSIWFASSGGVFTSTPMSVGGSDTTLVGDFDGNRRDDIFWYGGADPLPTGSGSPGRRAAS